MAGRSVSAAATPFLSTWEATGRTSMVT